MHLLDLNDDVLSGVIAFLSPREALALSKTSRQINALALDHAHSTVQFVSPGPDKVAAMCKYMLADPCRPLRLRTLKIALIALVRQKPRVPHSPIVLWDDECDASLARPLTELLRQAVNLTTLRLPCIKRLSLADDRIDGALSALPHLSSLALSEVGAQVSRIMYHLRSAPHTLELSVVPTLPPPTMDGSRAILESIHTLPSIRRVVLHHFGYDYLPPFADWPVLDLNPTGCWPAVTALEIRDNALPMEVYTRLFPNITELLLAGQHARAEGGARTRTWPALQRACGPARDFTALTTHAHLFEATDLIPLTAGTNFVAPTVRLLAPVVAVLVFEMHYWTENAACVDKAAAFWTAFVAAAPGLRSLELVITSDRSVDSSNTRGAPSWLNLLPETFASSGLTCIQICFDERLFPALLRPAENGTAAFTADTPLQALPARFARCVRSLEYVSLAEVALNARMTPRPIQRTYGKVLWWRSIEVAEERTVQAIPSAEGERIRLELQRSKDP